MKSFLNFIRKNGLYAFINLFGLTVSLAFVLLLAVFVSRQLTTDAFQKNADRIYLYANENFIGSAYYLQKHLLDHFPEVEKATSYLSASGMSGLGELTIAGSTTAVPAQTSYADSSFFDMFSFPLLSGSVYCRGRGLYVYRGWSYGGYRPFGNQVLRCDVPRRYHGGGQQCE